MAFINDGFSTTIGFALAGIPNVFLIHEKTVTPPGMSGGGPIDITTMRNLLLRTKVPKSLRTMENMTVTCAYDPAMITFAFLNLLNQNQLITVVFPDTSQIQFMGYLNDLKPQENREGEQPLANLDIVCTNVTLVGGVPVETNPVFFAGV